MKTVEVVNYLDDDDWMLKDLTPKPPRTKKYKYKSTRYESDVMKSMREIRKKTLGNVECARNVQKIKGRIMYGW